MKQKSLKIIMATAMTIFNLFVCFVATFAWFTNAKKDDASGLVVQMEANELKLDYEIYRYSNESNTIEEVNNFDLLPYDTVIKERNKTTPIVMKVTLFGNVLQEKNSSDVDITMHCTNNTAYEAVLSNITHFKFGALNITSTDISDIYYQTLTGLESSDPHKFITTVKLITVQFTLQNIPVSNSQITLYCILNYDEPLINAMNINYEDAPSFTNDIEYVRYGIHE